MITQYKAADPLDPTSQAEYKLLAGGATRTWVGTEDAYNAEKNNIPNNTMICITDDNMSVDKDVYSTTETQTNKVWINNKPIYRLVIQTTISVTASTLNTDVTVVPLSSLPLMTAIVNFTGYIVPDSSVTFGCVPINNRYERTTIGSTGIVYNTSVLRANTPVTYILEYTKG